VPLGEEPLRRYRRIFPCFAAEDAELVESVVAVAEALGDRYTADAIDAQRSGAPVEFALPQITDADVFQLFWSSHSMRSPACQRQWEQALAIGRDGFVRPLYWEEPFPRADGLPPAALAALRFVRLPHQAPRHHPVGEAPAGQVHAPPVRPPAAERPAAASASRPGAAAPPRRPPSAVTDVSAPSGKPPPAPSRRRPRSGIGAGISVGVALLIVSIVTGTTSPSGATLDPGAGDDRGSVLAVVSLVAGLVLIGGSLARWWLRRRR